MYIYIHCITLLKWLSKFIVCNEQFHLRLKTPCKMKPAKVWWINKLVRRWVKLSLQGTKKRCAAEVCPPVKQCTSSPGHPSTKCTHLQPHIHFNIRGWEAGRDSAVSHTACNKMFLKKAPTVNKPVKNSKSKVQNTTLEVYSSNYLVLRF